MHWFDFKRAWLLLKAFLLAGFSCLIYLPCLMHSRQGFYTAWSRPSNLTKARVESCNRSESKILQNTFLNPSKHGLGAWLLHIVLGDLTEYYKHKECREELKGCNTAAEVQSNLSIDANSKTSEDRVKWPANLGEPATMKSSDVNERGYSVMAPGTVEAMCAFHGKQLLQAHHQGQDFFLMLRDLELFRHAICTTNELLLS